MIHSMVRTLFSQDLRPLGVWTGQS